MRFDLLPNPFTKSLAKGRTDLSQYANYYKSYEEI